MRRARGQGHRAESNSDGRCRPPAGTGRCRWWCFCCWSRQPLKGRFCADTGRNMLSGGLDPVMHPVIDTLAFLTVRIVHDDGVAEGTFRARVPAQGGGKILPAAATGITGVGRREQSVIRYTGNADGEALLGVRRQLHAKGNCNGHQPRGERSKSGHTRAPYPEGAVVGPQTIAGPIARWQWGLADPCRYDALRSWEIVSAVKQRGYLPTHFE